MYQPNFSVQSVSIYVHSFDYFVAYVQLEMRSQDLQLAQTLLGLNTEIQRLRRESFGGVEVEGDNQQ